jgi:hypothetical protein
MPSLHKIMHEFCTPTKNGLYRYELWNIIEEIGNPCAKFNYTDMNFEIYNRRDRETVCKFWLFKKWLSLPICKLYNPPSGLYYFCK